MQRQLIRGMRTGNRHAGRILGRLMIRRPVDGGTLQKTNAHAVAFQYRGRTRFFAIRAGARMLYPQFVESRDRRIDCALAIVYVVGYTNSLDTGLLQRLAAGTRRRKKSFAFVFTVDRLAARRLIQTALKIAEDKIGGIEFGGDVTKWNDGIGDIHQVNVAGKHHL